MIANVLMNNTSLHITLSIEQIGLSVNFIRSAGFCIKRCISIIARTIPVAGTSIGGFPHTSSQAALLEHILNVAVSSLLAVQALKGGRVEVIPGVTNLNPATGQRTGDGIVSLLADGHQTGGIGLSTALADQLAVNSFISMAGSRHSSTPAYYGVTDFAESTAGIARLNTVNRLVFHGHRSMDMASAAFFLVNRIHSGNGSVHLMINAELLVGENAQHFGSVVGNIGDFTHIHINLQVLGPELEGIPVGLCSVAFHLDIGIVIEDTDGQRCNDSLTSLLIDTGTGNGNSSGIILGIDGVGTGEAGSQFHMIQFPVVDTVQVDLSGNRLNGLNVGSLQIHPVERAAIQTVQSGILGNQLNSGCILTGLDINQTDHNGLVTHVVSNFKLDAVDTVSHSHIVDGHSAVGISNINLDTVHISLGRSGIQTGGIGLGGVFSHGSRNAQHVGGSGNRIVLLHADCTVVGHQAYSTEDGCFTVIHCIGEVSGDIINVDGVGSVDSTVSLPQVIGIGVGEHEFDETEVVCIVLGSIDGKVGSVIGTRDQNLGILAHIHGEVTPAVFIHSVVNLRLVDNGYSILAFIITVVVVIEPVQNTDPAALILVGDVCPETNGLGILNDNGLVHIQIQLCIAAGGNTGCSNGIGVQPHGTVAVMDLAIFCGGEAQLMDKASIVAVNIRVAPLCNILSALKGEQDLGTLTQAQRSGSHQSGVVDQGCSQGAGQVCGSIFLRNRGEHQTVEGTQSRIGSGKGNVLRLQDNLIQAAVDGSHQTDIDFLIKGHGHDSLAEAKFGGNHDFNGSFADNCAIPDQLSSCSTDLAVGNEDTILDGTHGGISQLPSSISRNLSCGTNQVSTQSREGHSAAGGVVLVLSSDGSAGKLTVCRSRGDNQDTVGGGALSAVGGHTIDLQVFTGTLGQECGRTAAVTVDSLNTAQAQHELSHFIAVETSRVRRLAAVIHDHDDAAVGLDAHKGTGCGIRGVVCGILVLTVLYQEAEVGRNNLLFPTGNRRRSGANLGLGNVSGTGFAVLLIEVDDQDSLCASGLALAVGVHLAIQNQVAQRLTHQFGMLDIVGRVIPAQRQVHGSDHVAVTISFGVGSLLGHDLNLVVLCLQALSHSVGTGDNLDIRIVRVDLHHVGHLTVGTCGAVQDDLGFGDTGSQNIVGLADYLVVIIFSGGVDDRRRTEVTCIRCDCGTVIFSSKSGHGHHTHDHHNCQKHSQKPSLRGVMHVFSSF